MTETVGGTTRWDALEQRSPTAFLVAGALWLLDTVLLGIELLAGVSILGTPGAVNPVLYVSGVVAAIVGLLGLYPNLGRRTPRLARVSAGIGAVGGIAIFLLLVWFVTVTLLNQPDPPFILLLLTILLVVLGFVLFGIASVRTSVPSRTVGLLILGIPAALFVLVLAYVVSGGNPPDWTSPAIGIVTSTLLLAISYRLRTEPEPADRVESAATEARHG